MENSIMLLNIFDSLEEAEKAQKDDFENMKKSDYEDVNANIEELDKYYSITTKWANISTTVDGKFTYPVCVKSNITHATIEFTKDLFPVTGI